jgi:hypothetical protein
MKHGKFAMLGIAASLVLAVPVGANAEDTATAPSAAVDCAAVPTPDGCVSSIEYVDPASVTAVEDSDGQVAGSWDTSSDGTVVQLAQPVPEATAEQIAAANAEDYGLEIPAEGGDAPAQSRAFRKVGTVRVKHVKHLGRGSQAATRGGKGYADRCEYHAYSVVRQALPHTTESNMNLLSTQRCGLDETEQGVTQWLYRDTDKRARGYDNNLGNLWARAVTNVFCHPAGDHWWWNYSSFHATAGGRLQQGPAGFFSPTIHRCY